MASSWVFVKMRLLVDIAAGHPRKWLQKRQVTGDLRVAIPVGNLYNGTLAERVETINARTFTINPVTGELVVQRTIQAHQNSLLGLVANWDHLLLED